MGGRWVGGGCAREREGGGGARGGGLETCEGHGPFAGQGGQWSVARWRWWCRQHAAQGALTGQSSTQDHQRLNHGPGEEVSREIPRAAALMGAQHTCVEPKRQPWMILCAATHSAGAWATRLISIELGVNTESGAQLLTCEGWEPCASEVLAPNRPPCGPTGGGAGRLSIASGSPSGVLARARVRFGVGAP